MIYLDNRQDKIEINEELEETIMEIIQYTLKQEEVHIPCEISVIFVDNEEIREINNDMRHIDKVTDVLSFPMLEYEEHKVFKELYLDYNFSPTDLNEGNLVLGDMALSLERALEQSVDYGHSFLREVCYLVVHSILHLLGYDHMEEEDKVVMRKREEEILNRFNINR
ncbi:rRNA maturation RNase YbeY [Clostridium sp. UBA4548]|uniref:rRNA maturation RNase YbeY n=1 Tax=Clostridium sp. UBA4548 TaxID=1946361 RepID=UPI0025B9770B|nr:rRNA maturation RNase YbeY [Clostridium sp. UBA4548]